MRPRIYIHTSVIGGCFDEEFAEWSLALFREFEEEVKTAVFSDITIDELTFAPSVVQEKLSNLKANSKEFVTTNQEAQELAQNYLDEKIVSEKCRGDALHIATATAHRVDILVSWNFRPIVNFNRIRLFHAVNLGVSAFRNSFSTRNLKRQWKSKNHLMPSGSCGNSAIVSAGNTTKIPKSLGKKWPASGSSTGN